ncbi:helix-turn-helix domain-containing protein [Candidatus Gracilibacteria bacterium]|nr:helix-turn-helix domain-containing protein [Candidatus Gracilibacteria bacterium]
MKFNEYLRELGLNKKETDIYISLYKLGAQPASTIANHAGIERTYTYKALIKFTQMGIISTTTKSGVKHFFVDDVHRLKKYVEDKKKKYSAMEDDFESIASELSQFDNKFQGNIPKIALYDGVDGIANVYANIKSELDKTGYMSIKFFASNLVYSSGSSNNELKKISESFFDSLAGRKIHIDTFLGNGIMLMESIGKTIHIDEMKSLPADNSSINIFIVGKTLYIMIFKDIPIAIKIESPELAETLHFLFENVVITK